MPSSFERGSFVIESPGSEGIAFSYNYFTQPTDECSGNKKVQVGNDQEKVQSERESHSKNLPTSF